ncbi:MAG TPA: SRPBCC domain-containing protein [Verrucomicrobiae bacterium]|jgi:uncharacterized protein YndB with AHSA1/START domain
MKNNPIRSDTKLVVSRVIQAPCALVFRAWTEPRLMVQWFSPMDVKCHSVDADVRIGGAYRLHMISQSGDHVAIGTYQEIVANRRLRFTWEREDGGPDFPSTVVTVDFEDLGKTTRLTLTHEGFPTAEDTRDHQEGWTSALEKFGQLMEQNKIKADSF